MAVAIGDFNADGKRDLAVANRSNTVSILLGTGTGSFGAATDFAAGNLPGDVAIADFNADGHSDLVVTNQGSNNVSILLGTGTGSFGAPTNFTVGSNPYSVAVGEFNAAGGSDLVVVNLGADNVSILLGTGTGTFGAATHFAVGNNPASVAIGDFNAAGGSDLAVVNNGPGFPDTVSILLGTGTGTFGAAANTPVGNQPADVAIGDFNADGWSDLAVVSTTASNNVSIVLGNGNGTFGAAATSTAGSFPNTVAIGDFDADGDTDLAIGNNGSDDVSILLGNGNGTFGAATAFEVGVFPNSVAVGDFNADGRSDLAVVNRDSDDISILLGICSPAGVDFFTVSPCRVFDTRAGSGPTAGAPLTCGGNTDFTMVGGTCGVPAGAKAVSLNVAVTQPSAPGNLRLFASGTPVPIVSSLNYSAGQTRGNNAIAPLSAGGLIAARCAPSGTTHVIVDVNGYFQ